MNKLKLDNICNSNYIDKDGFTQRGIKIFDVLYEKNDKMRLIKTSFNNLNNYIYNWIYNRRILPEKIQELYDELMTNSNKIGWTLHAYRNLANGDIKLLDGQHRKEAIKMFLETNDKDFSNTDEITLWIYDIENEELNEDEIIELFKKINSNEPIETSQLPSRRKIELMKMIRKDEQFKLGIRANPNTVQSKSPYISLKQVNDIINIIMTEYPQLSNEEILNKMKMMNNRIRMMATNENVEEQLFKRRLNKKEKEIIEECREIKFYLNIKGSIFDNFKWIKEF